MVASTQEVSVDATDVVPMEAREDDLAKFCWLTDDQPSISSSPLVNSDESDDDGDEQDCSLA